MCPLEEAKEKWPLPQLLQSVADDAPLTMPSWPAPHATQAVLPKLDSNSPAEQFVQTEAPAEEYVPGPHWWHQEDDDTPETRPYSPAAHSLQALIWPSSAKKPGSHLEQDVKPCKAYWPGIHGLQGIASLCVG